MRSIRVFVLVAIGCGMMWGGVSAAGLLRGADKPDWPVPDEAPKEDEYDPNAILEGLTGVLLEIEELDAHARKDPRLTEDTIVSTATSQLKVAHINVLDDDAAIKTKGMPILLISVEAITFQTNLPTRDVGFAYRIEISLLEIAYLARKLRADNTADATLVRVWGQRQMGTATIDTLAMEVVGSVSRLVAAFGNAVNHANTKGNK